MPTNIATAVRLVTPPSTTGRSMGRWLLRVVTTQTLAPGCRLCRLRAAKRATNDRHDTRRSGGVTDPDAGERGVLDAVAGRGSFVEQVSFFRNLI